MSKHTLGVWHGEHVGEARYEDGSERRLFQIRNEGGDLVADVVDEDDAELIIRACNAHDELVAALQAMIESHGMHGPCKMNNCSECKDARNKAVAAIAKAQE